MSVTMCSADGVARFSTICKALQTSLFSEEEAQKYLQTYRARKLYVCRLPKEPPFEVQSSTDRPRKRRRVPEGRASAQHEVPGSMVEGSLGRSNQTYEEVSGLAGVSLSNEITAQLNADNNTPVAAFATAQGLLQDSDDSHTELVSGVAGTENLQPVSTMPADCNQVNGVLIKQPHVTLKLF